MSDIEFELEVGLEYDLSPIIGNKLISQILAAGGEFYIDGNIVVITSMPGKEGPPPAVIVEAPAPTPAPEPEEVVVKAPEPVVEPEPEPEPELSPAENLAAVEEVVPEVKVPVKRPRKIETVPEN